MKKTGQSNGEGRFLRVVAALCWLGIVVALVRVCHAGLMGFPAPGLTDWPWVPWAAAAALCAADSVLVIAWLERRNPWYLVALVALAAVSLGLEWCNVQHGIGQEKSTVSEVDGAVQFWEEELRAIRRQVAEQEARVAQLQATKSVWGNDGNAENDGLLDIAEKMLSERRKTEMVSMEKISERAGAQSARRDAIHPLASAAFSGWFVAGGLALLRVVAVALAVVAHGRGNGVGDADQLAVVPPKAQGRFAGLARRLERI